jgi:hypothetical protein
MGTDIHLEVEVLKPNGWERVPHLPRPCWSCGEYNPETGEYEDSRGWFHPWVNPGEVGEHKILEDGGSGGRVRIDEQRECYSCHGAKVVYDQIYRDRNYDVFGILADVRNGTGFAGIDTGDGFVPIAEPRGLPEDLSDEVSKRLRLIEEDDPDEEIYEQLEATQEGYWSLGDHSFSYVLLSEVLEDYDWSRTTRKRGWVDAWNFELWRRKGEPGYWSGGISGQRIEHISNQQMARMIDEGDIVFVGEDAEWEDKQGFHERPYTTGFQRTMKELGDFPEGSVGAGMQEQGDRYYTLVEWEVPYKDSAEHFLARMQEVVVPLAPDGDLSKVRLVFGFDS